MAGANKALKQGQVVFKAGDPSDGMYIVRKGELQVFLDQSGKETILAKIPAGGMVGEMALFDRQPRSASVRASSDCEVTQITNADFTKLMMQIPKWFVALMTALSTRLRQTNDRLQKAEAGVKGSSTSVGLAPFQHTLRLLTMLELLWHRDGVKEGKDWAITRVKVSEFFTKSFPEDAPKVDKMIEVMITEGFLSNKVDSYKNPILVMPNKAALAKLCEFLAHFVQKSGLSFLPEPLLAMTKLMEVLASKSTYDSFTASLEDLEEAAKGLDQSSAGFKENIQAFDKLGELIKVVISESKSGIGLRGEKPNISAFGRMIRAVSALQKNGLS